MDFYAYKQRLPVVLPYLNTLVMAQDGVLYIQAATN